MLVASTLEATVRSKIAEDKKADRKRRGSLQKAAFFIARGVFLKEKSQIQTLLATAADTTSVAKAKIMGSKVKALADKHFLEIVKIFDRTLLAYVKGSGSDADAALKNTKFAGGFEAQIEPAKTT